MAFKSVSKDKAEKLIASFSEAKKQHTTLNKGANKLLKAKEIKKLEKEMKDLGETAGKQMVDDLGQVRANFEQNAQYIQDTMIQCAQLVATAEKAVKRFEADPTPFETEQTRAITTRAVDEIKTKIVEAKEHDLDYGKSWFEYRGYNPVKDGLDEEYATKAADMKSSLMNDGKPVTAKIKSMELLQDKAQALVNRVEAAAKRGAKDIEEQRETATKLVDRAAEIAKAMEVTKGNNLQALRQNSTSILDMVAITPVKPEVPRIVRDIISNISAADKFLRERLQALKLLMESVKSEFDSDELQDDEIAKAVKKLEEIQSSAKKDYDKEIQNVKKAVEAGAKFIAANKT